MNRRDFLKLSAASSAAVFMAQYARFTQRVFAAPSPQVWLPGNSLSKFVDELPSLDAIVAGGNTIELRMSEFLAPVMPTGFIPASGTYEGTWAWGYLQPGQSSRSSYIGPVIVATRGVPTEIKWVNNLGFADTTNVQAYKYSSDQTLHWADPIHAEENMWAHMIMPPEYGSEGAENYLGPVPVVPHLHGGEVPPVLDGGPNAWYTSDGVYHGHGFYSRDGNTNGNYAIYRYPNTQEAAPIWFHDHTLGATRLAVYAGLAGGYLVVDPALNLPPNLPGPTEIIPLIIQDRSFDVNGQFFMFAGEESGELWALNPEHPYWVPEFVGDTIVINGKVWPKKTIERKRYRFLFLNGSNARAYEMFLVDPKTKVMGPPMWVIGTDGGYLDNPVKIDPNAPKGQLQRLTMLPGERYEVIIDFNDPTWRAQNPNFSGSLILKNVAKTPYPGGETPEGSTLGQMMKFVVGAPPQSDPSYNPRTDGPIRQGAQKIVRLVNPATGTLAAGVTPNVTRQLTLNEIMGMPQTAINPITGELVNYEGGPLEILVNNTKWDGRHAVGADDGMYVTEPIPGFVPDNPNSSVISYLSELPKEGETEIWEIVNLTADAHPIHFHLVQFQLLNRQAFNTNHYPSVYAAAFPGGGYDRMTGQPYPAGVFMPAWGPPLDYYSGNPRAVGGNPDITPYLQGPIRPPLANEAGWKDTVIMLPGQVTRVVVRWAPTDKLVGDTNLHYPFDPAVNEAGYVWHCHIIDHEDNEMMRPDKVVPKPGATRTYIQGEDY